MKNKKKKAVLKEEEEDDLKRKNVVKTHIYLNNTHNYVITSKL
jgi:hypothetical protein